MGAFGGMTLTNKGRNLIAKAQTGVELKYTRFGIGDGELGGQSIVDLNALISQKQSLGIAKLKIQPGGKAVVGTVISNKDITTGFYFREVGLFAQDPNEGEILFCYANCGPTAEYIPVGGGPDVLEKTFDIIAIFGNAQNVSAVLDSSLIWETPDGAQEKVNAHANREDNPHKTTAEQVGAAAKDHTHPNVTTSVPGFMSVPDKIKLDSIQKDAINKGTADTLYAPLSHVGAGGSVHARATATADGFMSSEDKDGQQSFRKYRSGWDSISQVFTTVEYKRKDGTLFMKSVLSSKVGNNYTVDTRTFYATNGTTVRKTEIWDVSYDSDGNLVNEVLR
ncbi:phage tail protein [Brevibacillus brevis]|uniref:phage tail-collar fiber domain-containing protein n=1 Tax=Brevibacillus brevis TaxID=1393 RepID=UPI001C8D96ED|nr:phage tail protein [Brevibacillus brevis]MBY0088402.1 phage tail protein [Brevibacillus brevis]